MSDSIKYIDVYSHPESKHNNPEVDQMSYVEPKRSSSAEVLKDLKTLLRMAKSLHCHFGGVDEYEAFLKMLDDEVKHLTSRR